MRAIDRAELAADVFAPDLGVGGARYRGSLPAENGG